jgi:hypothetical protein
MLENSKLYCYLFIYYFPSDKFEDPNECYAITEIAADKFAADDSNRSYSST